MTYEQVTPKYTSRFKLKVPLTFQFVAQADSLQRTREADDHVTQLWVHSPRSVSHDCPAEELFNLLN